MRKFLSVILLFLLIAPAIADDQCPMGYTPTKYTQLEYIESTGTQYIDTGVKVQSGLRWELDNRFTKLGSIGQGGSFNGTYANGQRIDIGWDIDGRFIMNFGDANPLSLPSFNPLDRHLYIIDGVNHKYYIDDDITGNTLGNITRQFNYNIFIFARNDSTGFDRPCFQKTYRSSLYLNNRLIQDLIPAKRNNDGEVGMYDTVTGHFFTNAGTGEFIAGPEILTENTCFPCPPNTYKDFVGNGDCTPCPDTFSSPSGATSINECGRILHVGDYVAHMPFGRRTEHGLCTMLDGKKYCADVYEKQ